MSKEQEKSPKKKIFQEPDENQHPMYVFDCVLFGIEVKGKTVMVGGGGGSAKTGMENKVYMMRWDEDRLKKISSFMLESDAMNSLNMHPKDKKIVASAGGKVFQISYDDNGFKEDDKSVDLELEVEDKEVFVKYTKDGKEIIASTNTSKLIILGTDLSIKQTKKMVSGLTSIDTSHCNNYICYTLENGQCTVWNKKTDKVVNLKCPLSSKHKKSEGEFRGCCFSKTEDSEHLFTYQVYQDLKRSYITKWSIQKNGEFLPEKSVFSTKFQTCISSKFNGKLISCGNSDGDVTIYTENLEKFMHCSPHKLFVSSVAFLGPNVLSISGDRVLYVTPLKRNATSNTLFYIFTFVMLIFSLLIFYIK